MAISSEQRDQVLRQPLALGNCEARVNDDIDLLAEHLSLTLPLREIDSIGPRCGFRQRSSYRIAGDTGLTAATVTPTRMQVDESSDCTIVLLTQGEATYELDAHTYTVQAGSTAIFLPGMEYSLESGLASGLVFNLSHQLLARYLCEASEGQLKLEKALHRLEQPHAIDLNHPALKPVLFGLKVLVRTIDSLGQPDRGNNQPFLHLQEGLYTLSTALLLPNYAEQALASWEPLPGAPSQSL